MLRYLGLPVSVVLFELLPHVSSERLIVHRQLKRKKKIIFSIDFYEIRSHKSNVGG